MPEASNDIPIEAWNTVLFDKFVRFRRVLTAGLEEHGNVALAARAYQAGQRVLDVGCGFGDTTLVIAAKVGASGEAVGVDCAENFIASATKEAAAAGVNNASYFAADVQSENLRGPYDHAFARFGAMFFNLPGAALRNIARSLKPGGEFTMVVWRKREDNPWVHDAERLVREMVPVVAHEDTDQVHCGPGPFSMAGPDMVSDMMQAAGFRNVRFQRHDCDICIGADMNEAVEFAMALGPAGEIIRLAGDEGERLRPKVAETLRAMFSGRRRGDEIWAGSSSWIVSGEVRD
ncbi:MAG: class I SAM-dependent methyltransferase [Caulobacteraceae bacterium]